ncbi:MAG: aminotransferase class I/II-fold pyridoxal phosphate-dependent enzyme [Thalassobaculum sp.]|uniref:pyridoxal phosphate-dependent aminotransferase n=1 Tax=Thalassobaculum sp. TaxID=2022740 RepID=UPI0032EBFB9E
MSPTTSPTTSYERDAIARMAGYVPGEQPARTVVAKLNTNENPYPPCQAVMDALRSIDGHALRRYPSAMADGFRAEAARLHGVTPDHVIATNGGDELLRLAITTFLEPGGPLGIAEPGYSLYPVLAAVNDSPLARVPLADDWSLPAGIAERWNAAGARLAMLVNPHAPSGRLTPVAEIAAVARAFDGVLLLDEAYVDFIDPARGYDSTPLVRELPNVLLLRTMSKGYSLAGLRFAYGIGAPALVAPMLTKSKDSYNVDAVAQALATASLRHRDEAARTWDAVRAERARVRSVLVQRGYEVPESETNFLLATVPGGDARAIYRALADAGIYVRWFDQDRLRDKLRISIGTPEENDALLTALDAMA